MWAIPHWSRVSLLVLRIAIEAFRAHSARQPGRFGLPGRRRYPPDPAACPDRPLCAEILSHSAEEETQYVELALGLIDTVDAQTRAAVCGSACQLIRPAPPPCSLSLPALVVPADTDRDRGEIERNDLIELFFSAPSEERRLILANLDVVSDMSPRRAMPVRKRIGPPAGKRSAPTQPG